MSKVTNLKLESIAAGPEFWADIAIAEADDAIRPARMTIWLLTGFFSAIMGVATFFEVQIGWVILAAFVGFSAILSEAFLPLFLRLDAGKSFLEQATTYDYRQRNGLYEE